MLAKAKRSCGAFRGKASKGIYPSEYGLADGKATLRNGHLEQQVPSTPAYEELTPSRSVKDHRSSMRDA
jgi:hypothetical protein